MNENDGLDERLVSAAKAIGLLGFVFIVFALGVAAASQDRVSSLWGIPAENLGNVGSLIAGISGSLFSLSGIFLIYEAIKKQREMFQVQQFESKFFELIKYHRENVSEITYTPPSGDGREDISGRRYFVEITSELEEIFAITRRVLEGKSSERVMLQFASSCHLIGCSSANKALIRDENPEIEPDDFESLFSAIAEKKANYDDSIGYFRGHRDRLDHYFRNIAQIIKYVDGADYLSDMRKKRYVKFFRAQLSDFELIYFFYQTFSQRGSGWSRAGFIDRYELIKNIDKVLASGVSPKDYFPAVIFDWELRPPTPPLETLPGRPQDGAG